MVREPRQPAGGAPPDSRRRKRAGPPVREEDAAGLNSIARGRAPTAEPQLNTAERKSRTADEAAKKETRSRFVPEEIRERFIGIGSKYYFPDGVAAFTDHGAKLTTRSENTEVIRSLVAIAQARNWGEIRLTGTEPFRKA